MKHLNLTFIVLGLFLFGCKQTDSKNKLTTKENSVDTTINQTLRQENLTDHEQLEEYKIDSINNVIDLFKEKNISKILSKINFPLYREYPIPPIKDREEFRQRFSEVFDNILIDKIANSKIDQWSEVGWRGIMLDNGVLWMANSDGTITSINYQSDFEKNLLEDLIAKEKEDLHISLKTFESPTYKIKTKNYLIRIDELTNNKYRYASWKRSEKESSIPNIILDNGELEYQGSGGNHVFTFTNNNYTYRVYRTIMGEPGSPDIILEVKKNGKVILTEDGTFINK
jgi:hypothetical protein